MTRATLLSLLVLLATAASAHAQEYRDSYPKNPAIDVQGYVFHLTFTDDSDEVVGVTTARALFLEPGQSALRLDLIGRSVTLDGAGMVVDRVAEASEERGFRHEGDELFIDLGREIRVGDRVEVTVHYSGRPAAGLIIGPNKYGDRTYFSDNWSSRVRNWLPVVDHPYDKATTEMVVVAPIPIASIATVVSAKVGCFRSVRIASFRSCANAPIVSTPPLLVPLFAPPASRRVSSRSPTAQRPAPTTAATQ